MIRLRAAAGQHCPARRQTRTRPGGPAGSHPGAGPVYRLELKLHLNSSCQLSPASPTRPLTRAATLQILFSLTDLAVTALLFQISFSKDIRMKHLRNRMLITLVSRLLLSLLCVTLVSGRNFQRKSELSDNGWIPEDMLFAMNPRIDPCDDFYSYA